MSSNKCGGLIPQFTQTAKKLLIFWLISCSFSGAMLINCHNKGKMVIYALNLVRKLYVDYSYHALK